MQTDLFQTPSGNILCSAETNYIRCDIRSGYKPIPSRAQLTQGSCLKDYGDWPPHSVVMGATGAAYVNCPTDGGMGERVLGYGKSWQNRSFVCVSELAGLTCKNRSGHGFSLSRERSTLVAPGGTVAGSAKVVIATEIFEDLAEWQARPLTINLAMGSRYWIDRTPIGRVGEALRPERPDSSTRKHPPMLLHSISGLASTVSRPTRRCGSL